MMKTKMMSLPLMIMPIGLCIISVFYLSTPKKTVADDFFLIIGCILYLFHLVWTVYISFTDVSGRDLVLMITTGKLILLPIYIILGAYALGLLSVSNLFVRAELSDNAIQTVPVVTSIIIILIFGLLTSGQMIGIIKMYGNDVILMWEAVLYSILCWIVVWDLIIAIFVLIRHHFYKKNQSNSD